MTRLEAEIRRLEAEARLGTAQAEIARLREEVRRYLGWCDTCHVYHRVGNCPLTDEPPSKEARISWSEMRARPGTKVLDERVDALRGVISEAYQVVGVLSHETATFDHPDVIRALDNLAAAADGKPVPHDDLLPFPKQPIRPERDATREAREAAIEESARAAKGHDAERITTHDAAAAYLVGRLDAASDVRALAAKPGSAT